MNIIVCIKQVPDTTDVKINPETNTLMREGVASIINPFDMYAIEEGVRLKEKHGGKVTVLSMGPPQAEAALREAIAWARTRRSCSATGPSPARTPWPPPTPWPWPSASSAAAT